MFSPKHCKFNNPNILGLGCNYDPNGVNLIAGTYGFLGLPTFFSSIFLSNTVDFINLCYGDSTYFTSTNTSLDSVLWDFGDPNSGISNSSSNINPFHIFSDTGTFHISLYSYFNGITDTATNELFVTDIPQCHFVVYICGFEFFCIGFVIYIFGVGFFNIGNEF